MTARVGVLGLGSIGLRHARNLLTLGAEVIGYDPSPERRALLDGIGGRSVSDAEAAIKGGGAVVIATPSGAHLEDLRRVVGAGRHAFVEKPLTHTADGMAEVLNEAEGKELSIFAAMNMRFHPAVAAAKAMLSAQTLGKAVWARLLAASYLPDWRPHQDYRLNYAADAKTGGALFDFIHEFDLAHHLLGAAQVVGASAHCSGLLDMPSEDVADVILAHDGGVRSTVHVDYVTRPRQRAIQIGLEGGVMLIDLEAARLSAWIAQGQKTIDQSFVYEPNDMYLAEMQAFLESVETGAPAACSGREALAVLQTVIAARRMCRLPE